MANKKTPPRHKRTSKLVRFDLNLVGMKYNMSKQERLQFFNMMESTGDLVCVLEPEPQNPADPMAVKVLYEGRQIGHVQRPANESLFQLLQRGGIIKSCFLTELDPFDGNGLLKVRLQKPSSSKSLQ